VPRKPRVEAPGAIHHVVARGVGDASIVRDEIDRSAFVRRLARAFEIHGWRCWAYCLMDSHFHLVTETPQPNLAVGMKWLKASYAQDFNYRHGRRGHLFGDRYYSKVVQREPHLIEACAYVVLNPVRAGLVAHPELWRWSSYRATAGIVPGHASLAPESLLALLGDDRQAAARRFVATVDLVLQRDRLRTSGGQTRGV
jgi:REP element-mobilizing transposase RayT